MTAGVASATPERFPRPQSLLQHVEFWKHIFATYSKYHLVVHDVENPGRVYSILDFSAEATTMSEDGLRAVMNRAEAEEISRVQRILERLHRHPDDTGLSVEEMRIRSLLLDDPHPDRFRRAADRKRVRAQRGIRERFLEGVQRSARYLPRMEQIFRDEGLPVELTRLPLIESSFNTHAYSKVGAAGMWQFMPATGRLFLRVDDAVDERLDPFVATRAAARFLRQNYDRLGTWPLAITAYNHGPGGMARAVRTVGTSDIAEIVARYDGPTFGFASKNFYVEFLAALDVHRDFRAHFGDIRLDPAIDAEEIPLRHYVSMRAVSQCAGADIDTLKALNPAVRPDALSGRRHLPTGYSVRLPRGASGSFETCYAGLPPSAKGDRPRAVDRTHQVRRGETVSAIARRYGVSSASLRRANGIKSNNLIRVGQRLKIPGASSQPRTVAPRRRSTAVTHRVRRGQTLAQIARAYGSSVSRIRQANGLRDANSIRIGESLRIPR
jgi:membrane-bound lytic murein transglycosylase D